MPLRTFLKVFLYKRRSTVGSMVSSSVIGLRILFFLASVGSALVSGVFSKRLPLFIDSKTGTLRVKVTSSVISRSQSSYIDELLAELVDIV